MLVDSQPEGWPDPLRKALESVTDQPVQTIINTHAHRDHVGGNVAIAPKSDIVAHANAQKRMAASDEFKGANAKFLPNKIVSDKLTLFTGVDQVDLYYFGKGHTGGDTMVYFPTLKILATGDLWAWKDAPLIDLGNDGSGLDWPKTLATALSTLKDADTIIPGHTPVSKPSELQEYQRYLTDLVAETQGAIKAGKSSADALAASTFTAKYPGYKTERLKAAIEAIYKESGK